MKQKTRRINILEKIEIKSSFKDWHEVDKETAKQYVLHLMHHITNIPSKEKEEYIEQNKIRGITVKELLQK